MDTTIVESTTPTARSTMTAPTLPWGAVTWPLIITPFLLFAAMFAEPANAGPSDLEMLAAYAADPARMDIAAALLHTAYMLLALGFLGAGMVVAGRGRRLSVAGGLLSFVGIGSMAGFLLIDYFGTSLYQALPPAEALDAYNQATSHTALALLWILPQMLGLVFGPLLITLGMIRAGFLRWWALAAPVVLIVGLFAGASLPIVISRVAITVLCVLLLIAFRQSGRLNQVG
jgi:hypothetical protein